MREFETKLKKIHLQQKLIAGNIDIITIILYSVLYIYKTTKVFSTLCTYISTVIFYQNYNGTRSQSNVFVQKFLCKSINKIWLQHERPHMGHNRTKVSFFLDIYYKVMPICNRCNVKVG